MPKVTIIMPSLNVASYIKECMDSVTGQTLTDIEIICVDAGSTDGTLEILKEYAQKDSRIQLIHSEKKSYGYQMNLGLRAAKGEYIGIVETDDYILPEMFEELYAYASKHSADFVKSDFHVFIEPSGSERLYLRYSLEINGNIKYDSLFTAKDYVERKHQTIDVFIWNGIYRRAFLQDNQIWFQETPGAAFQDCSFRYQVALSVERGYFLRNSYYRYRRDNAGASTYNNKCVLYNLCECKNLLKIAQEKGWTSDREKMGFLAREIAIIAHRPYVDLLLWGQPAEGTTDALEEFRSIVKGFVKERVLSPFSISAEEWQEICIFTENPDFYDYYAHLKARIEKENVTAYLKELANYKAVILFGSGQVGAAAYCTIRTSGLRNVAAFCDNDSQKWGIEYMGRPVEPPEECVKKHPDAYFVITNRAHQKSIQEQLHALGVSEERMTVYSPTTRPLFCTNMALHMFD